MKKRMNDLAKEARQKDMYSLTEALNFIKGNSKVKFDETVELSVNLGVDPKYSDQLVRGVVQLPKGTGKKVRVAVFARDEKADEAKKAGADIVGVEDLEAQIKSGKIDFDRCIATPDLMPVVGKLGKILGPRGLMPNPNMGTVTQDVKKAVEGIKAGQVEYRADKYGIVHAGVGKVSFTEKDLTENIRLLFDTLVKAKPSGAKGTYVKKASLSSTMGPGLEVDIATLR